MTICQETCVAETKLPGILELTPINPAFNDIRMSCSIGCAANARSIATRWRVFFLVSRHADVRGTLSDTTMWRGPTRAEEAAVFTRGQLDRREDGVTVPQDEFNANILMMDEPEHMRIREPFAKASTSGWQSRSRWCSALSTTGSRKSAMPRRSTSWRNSSCACRST